MKSFEEQFPSLKEFVVEWCEVGNLGNIMRAVSWMRIQEHCLDKQRVKEVIEIQETELNALKKEHWQLALGILKVIKQEFGLK